MRHKKNRKSNVYGSEEGYDLYAHIYDKNRAYLNSFESHIFLKMIEDLKDKKVLDAGCGSGRTIETLKTYPMDITALDVSSEMLKIVERKFHDVKAVKGDAEYMPFEDESFDAVVAMFLIVHINNPARFFDEVYRVLKDGGVFILSNVNQNRPPKLKLDNGDVIVIESFYHLPKHIIKALDKVPFRIEEEKFYREGKTWINQIIRAVK